MSEVFKKNWKWFLFPIAIILLYGLFLIFITFPISEYSIEKAAQLGDSFGIINTLFSGSAFIALIITIYLQQQEIRETKKETQKQNFENTFFKILDLYNSVVKDLSLERPKNITNTLPDGTEEFEYSNYKILEQKLYIGTKDCKGKEVIIELLNILNVYKNLIKQYPDEHKIIQGEYENFYKEYKDIIGHYFLSIYQILKFIDKNKSLNVEEKKDYINLFLAQISKKEMELFYFHVTSSLETQKIMPILKKYEIFK